MTNFLENRDSFQTAIGCFVIKFAELEFSLLYYCGLIDNPKNQNGSIREHVGTEIGKRRQKITNFITNNLPDVAIKWDRINTKLSTINNERRFLIHGIGKTGFYKDSIKAVLKDRGELKHREFSINNIKT